MDDSTLDQNLATQDDGTGGGAASDGSNAAGGDGSGAAEPFLRVDDRTVYKSREDAVRAYSEAGRRIATLSPFEKKLEKYYGQGKYDPETLDQHLAEFVQLRKEKAEREAAEAAKAAASATSEKDAERFAGKSAEEIKQIKAAEKWFRDMAEQNGYISKDSLKELQDKLAALEKQPEAEIEQSRQAMISEGQKQLQGWLGESNLTLTEPEVQKLASRIRAYVDGDDELLGKWNEAVKRGNVVTAMSIVREATEYALPLVKKGATLAKSGAAAAAAVKTKTELVTGTRRPLPAGGTAGKGAADGGKKNTPSLPQHRGIKNPDLTRRALEMIEASRGGGA